MNFSKLQTEQSSHLSQSIFCTPYFLHSTYLVACLEMYFLNSFIRQCEAFVVMKQTETQLSLQPEIYCTVVLIYHH